MTDEPTTDDNDTPPVKTPWSEKIVAMVALVFIVYGGLVILCIPLLIAALILAGIINLLS